MSETEKEQLTLRCPVCFARDNDVVLHRREDKSLYCVKCSFTGDEKMVKEMYADLKKKYRLVSRRMTLEEIEKM